MRTIEVDITAVSKLQPHTNSSSITVWISDVRTFAARFNVAEDNAVATENLLTLLAQVPTGGKQIHDANIVATMQAYGITHLLTHNVSDFARFSHYITIVPL